MELRNLEKETKDMAVLYESLRCMTQLPIASTSTFTSSSDNGGIQELQLPTLSVPTDEPIIGSSKDDSKINQKELLSLEELLSTLESMRGRITEVGPKMERYRQRLSEKDQITEKPRYGDATAKRVKALLALYEGLTSALQIAFGEDNDHDGTCNNNCSSAERSDKVGAIVDDIRLAVNQQKEQERNAELEFAGKMATQEAERKATEQQLLQEEQRAAEEARLSRQQEEDDIARRADEVRRAREVAEQRRLEELRRVQEEAARWAASIEKGPDGVRQQLCVLREKLLSNPVEHAVAINALHTLFSQIVSHPEETKFRRVRRDHPRFHDDIGRHPGGRELLIAAEFRLGSIDDVACFISTEPNLEKDMDGWSNWFDNHKSTLDIIEAELLK